MTSVPARVLRGGSSRARVGNGRRAVTHAGEWALARAIGGRSLNVWRRNLVGRGAPRTTGAPRRSRPTPPQPAAHALLELVPAAASAKDVAGGRYVLEVAGSHLEYALHAA